MNAAPPTPFWIDGHLDIAYVGLTGRRFDVPVPAPPSGDAAGCLSLPDLREAPVRFALGTIFTEARAPDQPGGYRDSDDIDGAHRAGVAQLEWYESEARAGRIRIVKTRSDFDAAIGDERADAPLAIVILMECADPMRTPDEASWWFERGVRVVGMSWSHGSRYSGGNAGGGRITALGKDLIAAFDHLGILHDVSHLSDASFDDLLALTPTRVVATHSNSRALLEQKERHLTDAQIRAIGAREGVIGLNLFGHFLAIDRPATLDDCVRHVTHAAQLIGATRVALGSDLDGGFGPEKLPIGLKHPRDYARLTDALAGAGWGAATCAGFRSGNWSRVLRETLR